MERVLIETCEVQTHEMSSSNAASGSSPLQDDLLETGIKEHPGIRDKANEIDIEEKVGESGEESEVCESAGLDDDDLYGADDLERLMSEIGNVRDSLRLMPDFQRGEMDAKLAMKMAAMFGESSDEDDK